MRGCAQPFRLSPTGTETTRFRLLRSVLTLTPPLEPVEAPLYEANIRGSDPLSSARRAGRGTPIRCAPPFACTLLGGGVSERPKEHASKACVGVTSPWVQIPPPPPRGPDETRGLRSTKPPEGVPAGAFSGGFAVRGGSRGHDRPSSGGGGVRSRLAFR